mmetsp:Transcript_12232/g.21646  ORF Transcript_12232/g.21646 Transcript_12232/m.21646 type:complete len:274 (+) Transcript_12232:695-1516(+)
MVSEKAGTKATEGVGPRLRVTRRPEGRSCDTCTFLSDPTSTKEPMPGALLMTTPSRYCCQSWPLKWWGACKLGQMASATRNSKAAELPGNKEPLRCPGVSTNCSIRARVAAAALMVPGAATSLSSYTTTSSTEKIAAALATWHAMAAATSGQLACSMIEPGTAMLMVEGALPFEAGVDAAPAAAATGLVETGVLATGTATVTATGCAGCTGWTGCISSSLSSLSELSLSIPFVGATAVAAGGVQAAAAGGATAVTGTPSAFLCFFHLPPMLLL